MNVFLFMLNQLVGVFCASVETISRRYWRDDVHCNFHAFSTACGNNVEVLVSWWTMCMQHSCWIYLLSYWTYSKMWSDLSDWAGSVMLLSPLTIFQSITPAWHARVTWGALLLACKQLRPQLQTVEHMEIWFRLVAMCRNLPLCRFFSATKLCAHWLLVQT